MALNRLIHILREKFPNSKQEIIVGDNRLEPGKRGILPEGIPLYGAPEADWEFGIWTFLLQAFRDRLADYDLVNLVTSAFENPPNEYLDDFSDETLEYARYNDCAIGHVDCWDGYLRVYGNDASWWLRSGFVFIPAHFFAEIESLCFIRNPEDIFQSPRPFAPDCPLSDEMQSAILEWLTTGRKTSSNTSWYGQFRLTQASMPLFIGKAKATLNERMLTATLMQRGVRIADISWLRSVMTQKSYPGEIPSWQVQRRELHGHASGSESPPDSAGIMEEQRPAQLLTRHLGGPHRLLYIDDKMLTPDQDSGSITSYELIKILTELGLEVDFVPYIRKDNQEYARWLEDIGVQVVCASPDDSLEDWMCSNGDSYDIIFANRPEPAEGAISLARKYAPSAKFIYNTIDLHFMRMRREAFLKASSQDYADDMRKREMKLIRLADQSIVLSKHEWNILAESGLGHKAAIIPELYIRNQKDLPDWKERRDIVFIGGFAHNPNVDAVLYFTERIFPKLRKLVPGVKFHIIGAQMPAQIRELGAHPDIVVHGFVPDLGDLLPYMRVAVAPLRYGAGIKGKIATCISYGIPVVGTRVAVESMPNGQGRGILGIDSDQEMVSVCASLLLDEAAWQRENMGTMDTLYNEYSPERGKLRILDFLDSAAPELRIFEMWPFTSWAEYQRSLPLTAERVNDRLKVEAEVASTHTSNFAWPGFCAICGHETNFHVDAGATPQGTPDINWRETLFCPTCGLNNRMRACLHYFYTRLHPGADSFIYVTERITRLYDVLSQRHPFVYGSEFMGADCTPGEMVTRGEGGLKIRHEDMTHLSFPDSSFNYVLSFDVLEYVPDEMQALRETLRVLRNGGTFLFSAPFNIRDEHNLTRAKMGENGEIVHLLPPEIHGNPVDPSGGALAFRAFGWEILDQLREAGFSHARAEVYWSRGYGYLGGLQVLFVAEKGIRHGRY